MSHVRVLKEYPNKESGHVINDCIVISAAIRA